MTSIATPPANKASGGKVWNFGAAASTSPTFSSPPVAEDKWSVKAKLIFFAVSLACFAIGAFLIWLVQGQAMRPIVSTDDYLVAGEKAWVGLTLFGCFILIFAGVTCLITPFLHPDNLFSLLIGGLTAVASMLVLPSMFFGGTISNSDAVPVMEEWTLNHLNISSDQVDYMTITGKQSEVYDDTKGTIQLKDGTEITFDIHVDGPKYFISAPRTQKFDVWEN